MLGLDGVPRHLWSLPFGNDVAGGFVRGFYGLHGTRL